MRRVGCLLLALTGCTATPPIQPAPRYEVGRPYQLGGFWSYPREEFSRVETGLAVVVEGAGPRRTENGEVWEGAAMLASHRSLQLPAIITLTNLENGRALSLRVNDRGPEQAGRMVGLSRRAGSPCSGPGSAAAPVQRRWPPGQSPAAAPAGLARLPPAGAHRYRGAAGHYHRF
jgi:rare lipoprotein A